jgi:hypothetical protein
MATASSILSSLRSEVDIHDYRKLHWDGSFDDYLEVVAERPEVTRTAYQRLYDMILSHGTEETYENKEKITLFKFFTVFAAKHGDSIYGIDRTLMQLINTFKSAAKGYGTEKRVLLLHGPVGSAKSRSRRILAHRCRGALRLFVEDAGRPGTEVPNARGTAQPDPQRAPGPVPRTDQRPEKGNVRGDHPGRIVPVLPPDVCRATSEV